MKPGSRDISHKIRIRGTELAVLKDLCLDLPESYGLDRKIAAYRGTRPIGFWAWDLDYLDAVFEYEWKKHRDAATKPKHWKSFCTLRERVAGLRPTNRLS